MKKFNVFLLFFSFCFIHIFSREAKPTRTPPPFEALKFRTKTPIKYVVVVFLENGSFDHFFGTYPIAENLPSEPQFIAKSDTLPPENLLFPKNLIENNPNKFKPFRMSRSDAMCNLCNPDHFYTGMQIDAQPAHKDDGTIITENANFAEPNSEKRACEFGRTVMGYYDGNSVTSLWNYAQRFSMSDNFFQTTYGPSTPGCINLISGQTHGVLPPFLTVDEVIYNYDGTMIDDPFPLGDIANPKSVVEQGILAEMTGKNIGDLLNRKHITWGWFHAGFKDYKRSHNGTNGRLIVDYIPYHEPFQYYRSTRNLKHLPPSSTKMIGHTDQANHQYDFTDFWKAAKKNRIPAVSYLKPPGYQEGHPNYSNPLAMQEFLVKTVNKLQQLEEWKNMAIIIMFDDSGGWYDHVPTPIVQQSHIFPDALLGPGDAGDPKPGQYQGRLGYSFRVPCLVLSPYSKENFIDHTLTDQTSILRFIEDNWCLGRIGDQSFDKKAGSIENMFDFRKKPNYKPLLLESQSGLVQGDPQIKLLGEASL